MFEIIFLYVSDIFQQNEHKIKKLKNFYESITGLTQEREVNQVITI